MKLKFTNTDNHHQCTTTMIGDWIVWKCPHCEGYERRFNARTGEMKVNGKTGIQHTGSSDGKGDVGALVGGLCNN